MNRQYVQDIVESMTKVVGVDKNRVSMAVALAIGYALPLPGQGVAEPDTFYRDEYRWKVQQFVSEFNERYLLDTTLVISGAQEVWRSRYMANFVHDRTVIEQALSGVTAASLFINQYDDSVESKRIIAEAAYLIHGQITPVILDMGKTGPDAK